jgi:hypothetical protein
MVKVEMNEIVMMVDGHGRTLRTHRGKVVKIGRAWITVETEDYPGWTERYRLDDQTNGGGYSYSPRFYTLAQWDERERQAQATKVIRDQGISINFESPWRGREVELAALLTAAKTTDHVSDA